MNRVSSLEDTIAVITVLPVPQHPTIFDFQAAQRLPKCTVCLRVTRRFQTYQMLHLLVFLSQHDPQPYIWGNKGCTLFFACRPCLLPLAYWSSHCSASQQAKFCGITKAQQGANSDILCHKVK